MLRERWHFCRDGQVLLGSRALRERHLGLLGYQLLPVRAPPPRERLHASLTPLTQPTDPVGNLPLPPSLQLPFEELESQRGLPQLKSYLRQKLQALGLRWGPEGG